MIIFSISDEKFNLTGRVDFLIAKRITSFSITSLKMNLFQATGLQKKMFHILPGLNKNTTICLMTCFSCPMKQYSTITSAFLISNMHILCLIMICLISSKVQSFEVHKTHTTICIISLDIY